MARFTGGRVAKGRQRRADGQGVRRGGSLRWPSFSWPTAMQAHGNNFHRYGAEKPGWQAGHWPLCRLTRKHQAGTNLARIQGPSVAFPDYAYNRPGTDADQDRRPRRQGTDGLARRSLQSRWQMYKQLRRIQLWQSGINAEPSKSSLGRKDRRTKGRRFSSPNDKHFLDMNNDLHEQVWGIELSGPSLFSGGWHL